MNLKQAIETAARMPYLVDCLQYIAERSAIRNATMRQTFFSTHAMRWDAYTTLHREDLLSDYVAELQTPQFQPWGTDGAYVTHHGNRVLDVIYGTESEAMRLATTIAQMLNQSGAVL